MTEHTPKEGTAAGLTYLVKYDEELWYRLSDETQEYCKSYWRERAVQQGAIIVALRLSPDPLMPMYGRETPYIQWQAYVEPLDKKPYNLTTWAFIEIPALGKGEIAEIEAATKAIEDVRKTGVQRYRVTCGTRIVREGKY